MTLSIKEVEGEQRIVDEQVTDVEVNLEEIDVFIGHHEKNLIRLQAQRAEVLELAKQLSADSTQLAEIKEIEPDVLELTSK